jgi:phosphate transport system protein
MRLQEEITKLKKSLLLLSAHVEQGVQKAVRAVTERNDLLAKEVIDSDPRIDEMEVELEEDCLKVLALHQPVAIDLRFIISILKINNDLERIGDLAVNIAKRASSLCRQERVEAPFDISRMAKDVETMLRDCLNAFVDMDAKLANGVLALDDKVDNMNRQAYKVVQEKIRNNPEKTECFIHALSVSRHLERIADHATNIAEDVIYMLEGQIIRHQGSDD